MRILSIDDSKAVHAYLTECLKATNFNLEHAYSGAEGLKVLETDKEFDLILLDWEMPEVSGPEVVERLNQMGTSIPIIMLTSKNSSDDILKMLSLGVNEYVMKPFTQDILFEKIENVKGVVIPRDGTK